MGKRAKRDEKRRARLSQSLERSLGRKAVRGWDCGRLVVIPAIDSWTVCACGKVVYRYS
jgi:hypothetical protein